MAEQGRCDPLSPGDLEEVRRFGAFLRASHGADEAEKRRIEHYPEAAAGDDAG